MDIPADKTSRKNYWVFGLAVLVVLGSFGLSYQIGKMIFIPVKGLPTAQAPDENNGPSQAGQSEVPTPDVEVTPLAVPAAESGDQPTGSRQAEPAAKPTRPSPSAQAVTVKKPVEPKPAVQPAAARTLEITSFSQTENKVYKVQVGPYATRDRADEVSGQLKQKDLPAFATAAGSLWKVQVGAFKNIDLAKDLTGQLKSDGYPAAIAAQ